MRKHKIIYSAKYILSHQSEHYAHQGGTTKLRNLENFQELVKPNLLNIWF